MTLPDCMIPDGAEPCAGYRELYEQNTQLRDENFRLRQALDEIHNTTVPRLEWAIMEQLDGAARELRGKCRAALAAPKDEIPQQTT